SLLAEHRMADGSLHARRQESKPLLASDALQLRMLARDGLDALTERRDKPTERHGGHGSQPVYPLHERGRHPPSQLAKQDIRSRAAGPNFLQNGPHFSLN